MRYNKIKGMHFIWGKWFGKYRWIYWECQPPIWWRPRFEKYKYGKRIRWLTFAVGIGIVTEQMMELILEESNK